MELRKKYKRVKRKVISIDRTVEDPKRNIWAEMTFKPQTYINKSNRPVVKIITRKDALKIYNALGRELFKKGGKNEM